MALHYVPPILAFAAGVLVASWLRRFAGSKTGQISVLVEIVFLIVVAILHNRLPNVAGTLGLSFVAAVQAASFPKIEGWAYSSVMATSNLRQAVEGFYQAGLRRAYLEVTAENRHLTVHALAANGKVFHKEMNLAGPIQSDAVTATYRNGVLDVTLPRQRGHQVRVKKGE